MLTPGQRIQGRYEVEALVGQGGLAEVYRVRHVDLGSVHALKLLLFRKKSLADRLLLEGRIQAQLRHPNVVAVTDVVRHEGQYGLLMEYVDNVSLDEMIAARGAIPVEEALQCIAPVMAGVNAAHRAGVLHRDLKPANVLLARSAGGVVPKVADFGIAKVVSEDLEGSTRQGVAMGTPGYMAPEQVLDARSVDVRTDVFALAAILYELIAGRRAFADESGEVSVKSTLEGTFVPLDELVEGVPTHVADAVGRALSRDRDDRPADMIALAGFLFVNHPELLLQVTGPGASVPISLDPSVPSSFSLPGTAVSDDAAPGRAGRGPTIAPVQTSMTYDGGRVAESASIPPPDTHGAKRSPALLWVRVGAGVLVLAAVVAAIVTFGPAIRGSRASQADAPTLGLAVGGQAEGGTVSVNHSPPADPVGQQQPGSDPDEGRTQATDGPGISPKTRVAAGGTVAAASAPNNGASGAVEPGGKTGVAAAVPVAGGEGDTDAGTVAEVAVDPQENGVADDPDSPTASTVTDPVVAADAGSTDPEPPAVTPVVAAKPVMPMDTFLQTDWQGRMFRQPFSMRITREQGGEVWAEGRIVLGAGQRTVVMVGQFDPMTGALYLRQTGGDIVLQGKVSNGAITGSYWRDGKGKKEPLSLARR